MVLVKVFLVGLLLLVVGVPGVAADPPSLPPAPLEGAPQNLTLQAGPSQLDLNWQPPANATVGTTYRVYVNGANVGTTLGLTFTVPVPGWASLYWVTAVTAQGESAPSSPAFASYGGTSPVTCDGGTVHIGGIIANTLHNLGLCAPLGFCEPIGVSTYSAYPFVGIATHDECMRFRW